MPHHAMEILIRHLIFRMAGQHYFLISPWIAVLILCLIYAPIAYFMFRSTQDSDQDQ